jgi:TetR/AcrR family transcriptional regulator, ethionamide resistance regulator
MTEAARELLRTRAYSDLTVDELTRRTGVGRTVFYRHFDDLPDLLRRASREAMEELYAVQVELAGEVLADPAATIERSLARAVEVYRRHGPLLRALVEAATADEELAANVDALRRRFDDLTERVLREIAGQRGAPLADPAQTARALTLMNEGYLLDAFGREPLVSPEIAVKTLSGVWKAVFAHHAP